MIYTIYIICIHIHKTTHVLNVLSPFSCIVTHEIKLQDIFSGNKLRFGMRWAFRIN